ncbi:MAG TPA: hypothetical protein VFA27_03435 [Vicinamibacterales bacterium]|nr:hypothetical protein [Vicinamibacterales bacterium]
MRSLDDRLARRAAWLAACAAYAALALTLAHWLIDDAGISYAYARSVAAGRGFVAQPGAAPVEGFSNFLWVVTLTPFFLARAFHPVLVPKLLSAALVFAALGLTARTLRRAGVPADVAGAAIVAVAIAPPIVIWTPSGLENALVLLLGAALASELTTTRPRRPFTSAILAALLAMTHPELVLLGATGLAIAWFDPRDRRTLVSYLVTLVALLAAFFVFRYLTFGLWLPHTYYAKRIDASAVAQLRRIAAHPVALLRRTVDLGGALMTSIGVVALAGAGVGAGALVVRGRANSGLVVYAVLALNAAATFLWMDEDWMGEYRFATLVIYATWCTLAVAAALVPKPIRATRVALVCLVAALAADSVHRVRAFAADPPTPYADVSRRVAQPFADAARQLGIDHASILCADIGATLFETNLQVSDLAGLIEPAIVHTLKHDSPVWRPDHAAFDDWVFDRVRPTFISTQAFWTYVSALERDPRFRRDYLAIDTYEDEYVRRVFGATLHSGNFVRRDALRDVTDVARLRRHADPIDGHAVAPEPAIAQGRRLDATAHPFDARPFWEIAARTSEAQRAPASFVQALTRLGDGRPVLGPYDALAPEMAEAIARLYAQHDPAAALALLDRVLTVNPSHYGATFQRARALEQLGDPAAAAAWTRTAWLADDLHDTATALEARAHQHGQHTH